MVTLALFALLAQNPIVSGDRSVASKCEVSADAEYGYTKEKPIRVGGTPMYGPARQRRFLQALAGPAGQTLAFKRRGSLAPNEEGIILDLYEVTYSGLEKPLELYLDLYRWDPPKAPKGFVCAREIGLAPPDEREVTTSNILNVPTPRPPDMVRADPDETHRRLLEVVLASDQVPAAIPLQPGSAERGMIFDVLRLMAIAARDLRARGQTPTAENIPRQQPSFLIVAHPSMCGGRAARASSIVVEAGPAGRITAIGGLLAGEDLQKALPGVELRAEAAGARFGGYVPRGAVVNVTFAGADCPPARFPLASGTLPRRVVDAPGIPPQGLTATPPGYIGNMTLKVSFAIGPDGAPFNIKVVNGDARYADAAIDAVKKWRFEMPTVNGAPAYAPGSMTTEVVFREGG